jgi:Tfp pilus assembly protein PilO
MTQSRSIWLLDLVGAVVLCAMVGAVGWYAFLKPDTASSRVHELGSEVSQLRADLRQIRHALDLGIAERQRLLAETGRRGRLPSRSPIDRDLETITRLADRCGVSLLGVMPISEVRYPNVRESRYQMQTAGTYSNLLRFLKGFEDCSFWADVTHIKLEQSRNDMLKQESHRKCDLILSFYSATEWHPDHELSENPTAERAP